MLQGLRHRCSSSLRASHRAGLIAINLQVAKSLARARWRPMRDPRVSLRRALSAPQCRRWPNPRMAVGATPSLSKRAVARVATVRDRTYTCHA